jgi:TRAP-type C4-dicarboxylate transport system permease small subunit
MPRIWRIPRIYPYSIIPIGSMFLATVFLVRLRLYVSETDPEVALHKRASAGQETGLSDDNAGVE